MSTAQAISPNEVASRLGVSRATVYRQVAAGEWPAVRIRNRIVIPVWFVDGLVSVEREPVVQIVGRVDGAAPTGASTAGEVVERSA